VGHRIDGYANFRWVVQTDHGPLLVKVRRIPNEQPDQIECQIRAQGWLSKSGFPTPELLYLSQSCAQLEGWQLSIQRLIAARPSSDSILSMAAEDPQRIQFFVDFGRAVGQLHRLDLPRFGGWRDRFGSEHATWIEAIRPGRDLREIRDLSSLVPPELLARAERAIDRGLAHVPPISPHLVHRDLHLDNTLILGERFAAVIDFELVREWDFPWDFSNRLESVFDFYRGSRAPFLDGYHDTFGELPASFPLRCWVYRGIYLVMEVNEYRRGNEAFEHSATRLVDWLHTPMPAD
jgi:Ser/Thr protein kinase RdoA (MazF antagonist)